MYGLFLSDAPVAVQVPEGKDLATLIRENPFLAALLANEVSLEGLPFAQISRCILKYVENELFESPEDFEYSEIDQGSQHLMTPRCSEYPTKLYYFVLYGVVRAAAIPAQ